MLNTSAHAVIILPGEDPAFKLPAAKLVVSTKVTASPESNTSQRGIEDTDLKVGAVGVVSAESRVVPANDPSAAVSAFGVVRSNPFGGLSIGWSNEVLSSPGVAPAVPPNPPISSRFSATTINGINHFRVIGSVAADVDIDFNIDGQASFRFDRPLTDLSGLDPLIDFINFDANLYSTRFGKIHLTLPDVDESLPRAAAGPGQFSESNGQVSYEVSETLNGSGDVIGLVIDYQIATSFDDAVFAASGDVLGLEVSLLSSVRTLSPELEFAKLSFENTFGADIASDTPAITFETVVPAPAALPLLGSALVVIGVFGRRRAG